MRKLLFIALCVPTIALADEPVSGPHAFEIQSAPWIGWSNYSGMNVGIEERVRYRLDPHWQLDLGFGYYTSKRRTLRDYSVGANYNFSEDWSRSWFVGAGVGLTEGGYYDARNNDIYYDSRVYTYLNAGRRFRLNESGTITWNPYLQVAASERGQGTISVVPLSFGFSF